MIPSHRSDSPPVGLSLLLPVFDGTPYLATRIEPELFHILLLPRGWPLYSQLNVAFRQAEANRLPTYFLLTPDSCLWLRTDGSVLPARAEPRELAVAVGKLDAVRTSCRADADLRERTERLREYAWTAGRADDLVRSGSAGAGRLRRRRPRRWPGRAERGCRRASSGARSAASGGARASTAGLSVEPLVLPVCCLCENDNECAWCGEPLFERRLQCNWYDEEEGALHYVPGFHALDHVCGMEEPEAVTRPEAARPARFRRAADRL